MKQELQTDYALPITPCITRSDDSIPLEQPWDIHHEQQIFLLDHFAESRRASIIDHQLLYHGTTTTDSKILSWYSSQQQQLQQRHRSQNDFGISTMSPSIVQHKDQVSLDPYHKCTSSNDSVEVRQLRTSPISKTPWTNCEKKTNSKIIRVRTEIDPSVKQYIATDAQPPTVSRTIFTYKSWDASQNQWSPTKTFTDDTNTHAKSAAITIEKNHFRISLKRGGEINIFPNLIDPKRVHKVKKELLESKFWRKYSIQGGDEPRLHFLVRLEIFLFDPIVPIRHCFPDTTSLYLSFLRFLTISLPGTRRCHK